MKSLLPMVAKYVATTIPKTKEEVILKAQHFDIINTQSEYLYTIIVDSPQHHSLVQYPLATSHSYDMLIGVTSK